MAADQLQQLRDIHLPPAPGWWPPAPGWWLLAVLVLAALVWLGWRLSAAERRRRPIRRARRLYDDLYRRYRQGELGAREYLNECNALIKRALIHGLGEQEARRATGQAWLSLLDRHLGEPAFTSGPGRLLGDARFRARFTADADAVHPLVERLLHRLTPSGARR
ncbi:MAG TPA: DUF4381 family protein [Pseudomonadales bacterium]